MNDATRYSAEIEASCARASALLGAVVNYRGADYRVTFVLDATMRLVPIDAPPISVAGAGIRIAHESEVES